MKTVRLWAVGATLVGLFALVALQWPAAGAAGSADIHGRIATANGAPVVGVTVAISGGLLTTTDEQGKFSATVSASPTAYTVTPSCEGYSFAPKARQVWTSHGDAEASFTATREAADQALAAALPDLAVKTFTVTPSPAAANHELTLQVSVTNRGKADVKKTFSLSVWTNWSGAPVDWRGSTWERRVPALKQGATSKTLVFHFKKSGAGTYRAWVLVDSRREVKESSETNNSSGRSYTIRPVTALPDLVVSLLTVAPNPSTLGQQVTASVRGKNQGGAAASGNVTLSFWRDGHAGAPDQEWTTSGGLAAGATTATRTFQFTPGDAVPTSHTAWAQIDRENTVGESNESNNTRTVAYRTQPVGQPDLTISQMLVQPEVAGLGQSINVSVKVTNQGSVAAGAFQVACWKNRNGDTPPADGTGADHTWSVAGLDPLAETSYLSWDFGAQGAGTFTVWTLADSNLQIAETDETNNAERASYKVVGPDLVISSLQVLPNPATLGATVTVTVVGKNQGNLDVPDIACPKISFFENLAAAPTTDAGEDHSWTFCGLAVDEETSPFTWSFQPAAAASYDAWAFIDSTNAVHELDETNNTKDYHYTVH